MKELGPYLNFNGNAREAMTFYNQVLGGVLTLMTFEDSKQPVPPEFKDHIMHSTIRINPHCSVMASDCMPGQEVVNGTSVTICINCDSEKNINDWYKGLLTGGTEVMPLQDTFWGARFGMLTDKFGIQWMFNFDKNPPQA
jgi:PhnB protein